MDYNNGFDGEAQEEKLIGIDPFDREKLLADFLFLHQAILRADAWPLQQMALLSVVYCLETSLMKLGDCDPRDMLNLCIDHLERVRDTMPASQNKDEDIVRNGEVPE